MAIVEPAERGEHPGRMRLEVRWRRGGTAGARGRDAGAAKALPGRGSRPGTGPGLGQRRRAAPEGECRNGGGDDPDGGDAHADGSMTHVVE